MQNLNAIKSNMGIYRELIFPRLLELTEHYPSIDSIRQRVAEGAMGHVLEIGAGIGTNFWFYPSSITSLTTIETNPALSQRARKRIKFLEFPVDTREGSAEKLPMKSRSFDCVLTTFTLCRVKNIEQSLEEIYRVLKPGGRLLFAAHGHSKDPEILKWQRRLSPVHRILCDGCHFDRRIDEMIKDVGFFYQRLDCHFVEKLPRSLGHFYEGVAVKEP